MAQLRPALDAALDWIDESGDRDGDGFVEYERRSPAGLVNHGWKDSHDSIVHADGSLAEGPIALVEVQGYVYEAKLRIADVYEALGDAARADRLRAEAAALRVAFNEAFWDPERGVLRARAGRPQGTGAQRHVEPRALPVLRDRRRRQGGARRRAPDGAGHVLGLGDQDAVEHARRPTTR